MQALWLVTLVATAFAVHQAHASCVCPGSREWSNIANKADAQEARLNRLGERVTAVHELLNKGKKKFETMRRRFSELSYRVTEVEGKYCPYNLKG